MPDRAFTLDRVLALRLSTQGLTGPGFITPAEAVRHLLAVQAQDAPLARWSLSLRSGGPDDNSVRAAVDDGTLVRTHLLRPTWHYVAIEDLRWLVGLTGPKVLRTMGSRMRALGLEAPAVVRQEVDSLVRRLAGHPLTRGSSLGIPKSVLGLRLPRLHVRSILICDGDRDAFASGLSHSRRPSTTTPQPRASTTEPLPLTSSSATSRKAMHHDRVANGSPA